MSEPASSKPSETGGVLQAAAEHRAAGRLREAEGLYRRVLRDDPENSDALHGLGLLALQVRKSELAAAYLGQAAEVAPRVAAYQRDHGGAWMLIGDFNQAAACYRRALALDSSNAESHAGLGMALGRLRQFEGAIQFLRKSIDLGVRRGDVYQNLANALLQLNRFGESEAAARTSSQIAPDSAEAWQTLGEALGNLQRNDEAMECFGKAIALKTSWPLPHYALGITLGRAGKVEEAVHSLKTALRMRPEFPEAASKLGMLLVGQHKLEEAIATLRKAVQLRPNDLNSHIELARALELAQRPTEAAEAFRQILKLSPNNQNVMFHMAALSGSDAPPAAPAALVTALFNRHADTFDHHLLDHLEYRVPRLLADALAEANVPDELDVLDLGCGTGLCGQLLRPRSRTLAGLDLSAAMVEKARERGVYDQLNVGEIVAFLRAARAAYDLLVAGDVFCYLGDLSDTISSAFTALRPGGFFAFSVELNEESGWVLRSSRRYAHSPDYIREAAARCGFQIVTMTTMVLRKEGGKDLQGLIVILARPSEDESSAPAQARR